MNNDRCPVWRGGRGSGGDSGFPASKIYYCGRRMNQCRCGTCDGNCGPTNGCPCNSCRDYLSRNYLQPNSSVLSPTSTLRNGDGYLIWKGGPTIGVGGDTGLPPRSLYYCGRNMNQCRCGSCDGRCGPTNGCPCLSCKKLLLNSSVPIKPVASSLLTSSLTLPHRYTPPGKRFSSTLRSTSVKQSDCGATRRYSKTDNQSSAPSDSDNCIICLDAAKEASFIHGSTAHFSCCLKCALEVSRKVNATCPVCRSPIDSVVQTFN